MQEQFFGLEHPSVALTLNNLAFLFFEQGKYTEAEPLYQRALHIWERQVGSGHPRLALSLSNLALHYTKQGQYTEAESLYERALDISEQRGGQSILI